MTEKTIKTYQSLGRLIIDAVYDELLKNKGPLKYKTLRNLIYKKCIEHNDLVDKSFAMHKIDRTNSIKKGYISKKKTPYEYRWESIMRYYLAQQSTVGLLQERLTTGENPDRFYYLPDGSREKLLAKEYSPFDMAKTIIKKKFEQRLNEIRQCRENEYTR